jgi:hypothetical protein
MIRPGCGGYYGQTPQVLNVTLYESTGCDQYCGDSELSRIPRTGLWSRPWRGPVIPEPTLRLRAADPLREIACSSMESGPQC